MTNHDIIKKYKVGGKYVILGTPSAWSSLLKNCSPLKNNIKYPYKIEIKNIRIDIDNTYVAMTCGEYGWSMNELIDEKLIVENVKYSRIKKLQKITKNL